MSQTDTLQGLLKRDYALVLTEVPVLKKKVDIICSDGKILSGIVVRSLLQEMPEAIGICSYFRQGFHKTYIALPEKEALRLTYEKKILEELGIGLISFSAEKYTVILESKRGNPDKQTLKAVSGKLHLMSGIRCAADIYKALGHPTRLEIYLAVCGTGEAKLKDIAESCGGCYPLVMKHIKVLEDADLIESEKIGKETTLKLKSRPVDLKDIAGCRTYTDDKGNQRMKV